MGGVAMAAGIDALEQWAELPLLWATIQFVGPGRFRQPLNITCEALTSGRSVRQATASLTDGGELRYLVTAALGARDGYPDQQFEQMPQAQSPESCPENQVMVPAVPGDLMDQFDRRVAFEDAEAGQQWLWLRPRFDCEVSAPLLGLVSDFIMGSHPKGVRGTSLDNTLRIHKLVPTDWILCAAQTSSFVNGAMHAHQRLFAEDGTLLGISSQTGFLPRTSMEVA